MPDVTVVKSSPLDQFKSFSSRIVVELTPPNNSDVLFDPTGNTLRGNWSLRNMKGETNSRAGMGAMPDLPGMRIEIEPAKGRARIFDPLNLPEFAETMDKANAAYVHVFKSPAGIKPVREKLFNLKANEVATWLYWLIRYEQDGIITVVEGELPTSEEFRLLDGVKAQTITMSALTHPKDLQKNASECFQ